MDFIKDIAGLEALYDTAPSHAALAKVAPEITPLYARWIERARFCVMATVGPEGADASPRGDDGAVVQVITPTRLALPDWKGNNRIDSLRNIVRDGRIALLFLVPGALGALRVNGRARLTADAAMLARFARDDGARPRSVVIVDIGEVYVQGARALARSDLWGGQDHPADIPGLEQVVAQMLHPQAG
ncbi:MAG: MSMEG_1061 family FMN-dependent PPOX-type flavoprotein [Paracoccaceae bacterium]